MWSTRVLEECAHHLDDPRVLDESIRVRRMALCMLSEAPPDMLLFRH